MRPAQEVAEKIVDEIIDDLDGRRGLGLDSVDEEIQADIRQEWITICLSNLTK